MRTASLMDVMQQLLMHADLSANGLAKILNLPTPTIHRLATGDVQDPRSTTMTLIANYFGISIDQLLGREELDPRFDSKNCAKSIKPSFSIPLLTMNEVHALTKHVKAPSHWFRFQSNNECHHYEKLFAISIKNNLFEPLFYAGSVIVINPAIAPDNGDYVLVSFDGDHTPVLKRYNSEGKNKYLSCVNSNAKIAKLNLKESMIIGVVIETYRSFKF